MVASYYDENGNVWPGVGSRTAAITPRAQDQGLGLECALLRDRSCHFWVGRCILSLPWASKPGPICFSNFCNISMFANFRNFVLVISKTNYVLQHFYRKQFVCWIFASTLPTSRLQGHGRAIPVAVVTWWMFSWATRMRLSILDP